MQRRGEGGEKKPLLAVTHSFFRYAYYRAVISVTPEEYRKYFTAFESWGSGTRFGVVPLKEPEVFFLFKIDLLNVSEIFLNFFNLFVLCKEFFRL
jgi:hypothetical protein